MRCIRSWPAEVVDGTTINMGALTCDECGEIVFRVRFTAGRFLGVDCRCVREKVEATCTNPYADLTIQHVHDEHGKPIRVTSARQLGEAEQRYNFASVVRNMDAKNFNAPPQARKQGIKETYQRKFHYNGR